ncbi:GHKL domain-containing protein [Paenibacillus sp. PR3]|uniref:histidine kinase n=1 Tax=Paenibacillus terricola TaxID=2763503 RepID=A0ABR8N0Q6_9BACL|nr:ATP-binding protein [Paenibacillus terricola]MBD3920369.1 GHKL domain-containing protein [Paenibacillus terricola]
MFTVSIIGEKAFSNWPMRITIAQVVLLLCFHEVSQLNWCFTIYIILLTKVLYQHVRGTIKAVLLGFGLISLYTIIRASYTSFSTYSLLASTSDFLTSLAVVLIIQYIVEMERQKNALKEAMKREEMMFEHEKMRVVGELAAGLAHEIRNPLASLRGFLQHSKQRQHNIEPWYDLMMDEISRMNKLTVEFLQFSKPDPSSYRIHSLHECLQKVVYLTGPKVSDLGLRLVYVDNKSDMKVRIDMSKMVQVFVNILNNALESMAGIGSGTVTLRLSQEGPRVVVEVQDTGEGIRAQDMKQIFNPFFTTKVEGTGLGLPICKKIVQDHGGEIEVSSSPGLGTTFSVSLPAVSD